LDPRSEVRVPPLPRRTRQRDEHRRVVTGDGDLQRLLAEQPSPFPRLAAVEPRGMGIRLWLRDRQGHEGPGFGAGDEQGRDAAQGRSAEVPGVLEALPRLPGEERIQRLAHEAGRYRLVGQTVRVWPLVLGVVVSAKQLVDPREMDGEVL